jgi:hypothetical protein
MRVFICLTFYPFDEPDLLLDFSNLQDYSVLQWELVIRFFGPTNEYRRIAIRNSGIRESLFNMSV